MMSTILCCIGLKDNYDEEKKLAVGRRSEVKNLPMEDTVWLIEELFVVPGMSFLSLLMEDTVWLIEELFVVQGTMYVFLAHLSRRLIDELIGYSWSGVRLSLSGVNNIQRSSSPKPLGQS